MFQKQNMKPQMHHHKNIEAFDKCFWVLMVGQLPIDKTEKWNVCE